MKSVQYLGNVEDMDLKDGNSTKNTSQKKIGSQDLRKNGSVLTERQLGSGLTLEASSIFQEKRVARKTDMTSLLPSHF